MPTHHVGQASLYCQALTTEQAVKQIMEACTGVDRLWREAASCELEQLQVF